jgi:uncharacterized membrane protein
LGIYDIYWFFKTKTELKSLGADIPSAWLMFIPLGNVYFYYKYAYGFTSFVKKDSDPILYFFLITIPMLLITSTFIISTKCIIPSEIYKDFYKLLPYQFVHSFFILGFINFILELFTVLFVRLNLFFIMMVPVQTELNKLAKTK